METNYNTYLVYFGIAMAIGLLSYILYSSSYRKYGISVPTSRNGRSIKFHYFYWFFLLIVFLISGFDDYSRSYKLLNIFPYSLLMFVYFVSLACGLAAYIGFFKYTKYSWYCNMISLILFTVLMTIINVFIIPFPSNELDMANRVGNIIGLYISRIPEIIYYSKRKHLFTGEPLFINKLLNKQTNESQNEIDKQTDDVYRDISINENHSQKEEFNNKTFTSMYCRKCGTKIEPGTKFCRKCGTKVSEE